MKALVFERDGKVVKTPRQLANFINSKLADWGADRVRSYLDNLEKYKDSIDFTE